MVWEWITTPQPSDPSATELPLAEPEIVHPVLDRDELRITWVGHATFLIQLRGLNVLTDPVWSLRVSPVSFWGSKRFVPAVPALDRLPPIHAVLISHDHYDHLDRPTILELQRRFGESLVWLAPLGHAGWFQRLGIDRVVEADWWDRLELPGGDFEAGATPARHWTRRTPASTNTRLWCSWAILPAPGRERARPTRRVYFGGDSGHGSFFKEIGERLGPFDASLLPIGAYEPRWFMYASHMNPEEAVDAYRQLGSSGAFVPTHWGTFRLTFEDPLEPPVRTRAAWEAGGFPEEALRILRHGETATL